MSESALIEAFKNPAVYPHAIERLEIITTHISWVILTGTYAYKIKRPVKYSFVDYSSLENRKAYCEKEFAFNQSLASKVYKAVLPIRQTANGPSLLGDGPIIDYALQMLEFPQDKLLSTVIKQNEITASMIDDIATQVAYFHQSAPVAALDTPYGTSERILKPVKENFSEIRANLNDELALQQLQHIETWALATHAQLSPLMQARKQAGLTRACHGDLHLRNIVLIDQAPVIFDCIEFCETRRWLDPMAEIGFFTMDLMQHGRTDLAIRFLSTYMETTGDYPGLQLLPFFMSYRALVRAKIQLYDRCLTTDAPEQERFFKQYQQYANFAESLIIKRQPILCVMHGVSGSGKSTLAQEIILWHHAIRLRADVERKRWFGHEPSTLYSEQTTEKTYTHLLQTAAMLLKTGLSVVIDARFAKKNQRDQAAALANALGIPFKIINCTASQTYLEQGIVRRMHDKNNVSDATLAVLEKQLNTQETFTAEENAYTITIPMDKWSPEEVKQTLTSAEFFGKIESI